MTTTTQQFQLQELYDIRLGLHFAATYWQEKARQKKGKERQDYVSISIQYTQLWARVDTEIKALEEGEIK